MSAIALQAAGIRKSFAKNGRALQILDVEGFSAREGEFITLIGPSGCGKSTLLHIMGGFIPAEAGRIEVYGQEVRGPGPDRGMMFQEFALFPWKTVAGNIAWGLEVQGLPKAKIEETVGRYLDMIGLRDFRNHYPAELSGGMKQRAALARVLAFDPKVLLMDEPFGALDAQTREVMHDLILHVHALEKTTLVFVTHDVEEAIYLGHRVVLMAPRPGRVDSIYDVPLPVRRDPEMKLSPEFIALKREILARIRATSGMKTDLEMLEQLTRQ